MFLSGLVGYLYLGCDMVYIFLAFIYLLNDYRKIIKGEKNWKLISNEVILSVINKIEINIRIIINSWSRLETVIFDMCILIFTLYIVLIFQWRGGFNSFRGRIFL